MGWFFFIKCTYLIPGNFDFSNFELLSNFGQPIIILFFEWTIQVFSRIFFKQLKKGLPTLFNKSHEKINTIFVISAIIASIWNVFIKFRWHDEKLTYGTNETLESKVHWWLVWGRSQKKNWKPHLCTYLDLDDLIHLVYLIDPWTPLNPPEPCWRYEIRGFASPSRIVLISADLGSK